jgi:hypothetical protein
VNFVRRVIQFVIFGRRCLSRQEFLNEAKPVVAMEWEFGDVICGYRIDGFRDMEVILVIKS